MLPHEQGSGEGTTAETGQPVEPGTVAETGQPVESGIVAVADQPATLLATMEEGEAVLKAILRDNFGDDLQPVFDRIKIPTGGGLQFIVPTAEGEDVCPIIEGVVLIHHSAQAYWDGAYKGGRAPDCSSLDGKTGIGDPSGPCDVCPLSQWGSDIRDGEPGLGKACKQMRRLYVLRTNEHLPILVTLPPTSLRGFAEYASRLTRSKQSILGVTTRLSLIPDKNAEGIEFSKAVLSLCEVNSPEMAQRSRSLADMLRPYIGLVPIADNEYMQEDIATDEGDAPPASEDDGPAPSVQPDDKEHAIANERIGDGW